MIFTAPFLEKSVRSLRILNPQSRMTEPQIAAMGNVHLEAVLDLLMSTLEEAFPDRAHQAFKKLLSLILGTIPKDSLNINIAAVRAEIRREENRSSLQMNFLSPENEVPDTWLQNAIQNILKVFDSNLTEDTNQAVYSLAYRLLHQYRLNKRPHRDDSDMLAAMVVGLGGNAQPGGTTLSKLLSSVKEHPDVPDYEPSSDEIGAVFTMACVAKIASLGTVDSDSSIEREELLFEAVNYCLPDAVSHLLKDLGVNPNAQVSGKPHPLYVAIHNRDLATADVLLKSGADIEKRFKGNTVLYIAADSGCDAMVEHLLQHPKVGAILNAGCEGNLGETPLFVASMKGHAPIVDRLLRAGANIKEGIKIGSTALYVASREGHAEIVRRLLAHEEAREIVNVPCAPAVGATPLFIASMRGHVQVVDLLLNCGADPDISIQSGQGNMTALEIAQTKGHSGVVQLLSSHLTNTHKKHTEALHRHATGCFFQKPQKPEKPKDSEKARETIVMQLNKKAIEDYKAKQYTKAIAGFRAVLKSLLDSGGNPALIASTHYNLGSAHMKCEELPQAYEQLLKACDIAAGISEPEEQAQLTKYRARLIECSRLQEQSSSPLKAVMTP